MDDLEVVVGVGAFGELPVHIHRFRGHDPGVAIGVVHQVQVLIDVVGIFTGDIVVHDVVFQDALSCCRICSADHFIGQEMDVVRVHRDHRIVDIVLCVFRCHCGDGALGGIINRFCVSRHSTYVGADRSRHFPVGSTTDGEGAGVYLYVEYSRIRPIFFLNLCLHLLLLQQAGIDGHVILLVQRIQIQGKVIAQNRRGVFDALLCKLYPDGTAVVFAGIRNDLVNVPGCGYACDFCLRLVTGAVFVHIIQFDRPISIIAVVFVCIREFQ